MRYLNIFALSLLLFVPAASAQARTGTWKDVQQLRPGTPIFVDAGRHVRCVFLKATEKELDCDPIRVMPLGSPRLAYRLDRRIVRKVQLEHSDATNAAVGTLLGAGVGAGIFAARAAQTGGSPGDAAPWGALFGGVIGHVLGKAHPISHGKVIYKR